MQHFFKMFSIVLVSVSCGALDSSDLDHDTVEVQQGPAGDPGATGATGEKGETGAVGAAGSPAMFAVIADQNETEVGYYLERVDFDANTFEILTIEGYKTVLNLDTGVFTPPTQLGSGLGFSCMYTSNDCSGACFGVNALARGYLLKGQSGSSHYVDPKAATTSITSESHNKTSALSTCVVQSLGLATAVPTATYSGILTGTLSVPLYLKVQNQ